MKYSRRWVTMAALVALGCSDGAEGDRDAGAAVDARREVCFPSCRLREVCTAANRCEPAVSPFRDAGATRDRGAD